MGREPVVRRGLYNPTNRHGDLQDVNQDNQVSFADTFLGDLLGFDGQVGTQGRPGMAASMGGARRRTREEAVAEMQAQGIPMTQQNLNDLTSSPRPQARPEQDPGGPINDEVLTGEPTVTSDDVRDETQWPSGPGIAATAAAGALAAGAVAKFRDKRRQAITPDADGMVLIETSPNGTTSRVPAAQAADDGWQVVGINYNDGSNALPGPVQPNETSVGDQFRNTLDVLHGRESGTTNARINGGGIENVSEGADGSNTVRPNQGGGTPDNAGNSTQQTTGQGEGTPRPAAEDPASAPIGTEEIVSERPVSDSIRERTPQLALPDNAQVVPNLPEGTFVQGGTGQGSGFSTFTSQSGQSFIGLPPAMGGGYIEITPDNAQAVRAAIRGAL